jgi:hypothetical protein
MITNTSPTIQPFSIPIGDNLDVLGFDIQSQLTPRSVPELGTHVLSFFAFASLALLARVLRRIR